MLPRIVKELRGPAQQFVVRSLTQNVPVRRAISGSTKKPEGIAAVALGGQRNIFDRRSTVDLERELLFLRTVQTTANSQFYNGYITSLITDPFPSKLRQWAVSAIQFIASPVISYFCKPSIQALEGLIQSLDTNIVATDLSEHVTEHAEVKRNKETLRADLASNINFFAVKPSAVCRQSVLESGNSQGLEVQEMFDYFVGLCKEAERLGKTIILDAEARLTKPVGDVLVQHLLENNCPFIATIQASYKDAVQTLEQYHQWSVQYEMPFKYKIVKGAYVEKDQENPITVHDTSQSFDETHERYLELMAKSQALGLRPIIASHNQEILQLAAEQGLLTGNLYGLEVQRTDLLVVPKGNTDDAFHWTTRRISSAVDGTGKRIEAIGTEIRERGS